VHILELLRSDGSITVNKSLIQAIGLNESVLFCELLSRHFYFQDKGLEKDGYFYNTQYDLQSGTGLGEKAQRTAISNLKKLGLLKMELKGIPARRHFKIVATTEIIEKLLSEGKEKLKRLAASTDTSIGGNLKRTREVTAYSEGSTNNTNNNTHRIIQRINVVDAKAYDIEFYKYLFEYFFEKYHTVYGKEHPLIKQEYIIKVMDNIEYFCTDYDVKKYTDWERIIDTYLKTKLACDRNIIHFSEYDILYNRVSNLKLLEG
jgi:hypothetical protein